VSQVEIVEVGPRDGLQNEEITLSIDNRVELIARLGQAGVRAIEVGSFVRPDRIPQMADSEAVFVATSNLGFDQRICLVPNLKGLETARRSGVRDIAVFVAASETFNIRNTNCSVQDGLNKAELVVNISKKNGMKVRAYVSTVVGCPYEGKTKVSDVVRISERLFNMGCDEISLGDTIGIGKPNEIKNVLTAVRNVIPVERLAFHGHDTYGMGLANALVAINCGVRRIDASIGGLGGCPFGGVRAKGNLATEDLVYALGESEFRFPPNLSALVDISWWLAERVGHDPRSAVALAAFASRIGRNH